MGCSAERKKNVRREHILCKRIGIGGYRFERDCSFSNLDSIINKDNRVSVEITQKINPLEPEFSFKF